MEDSKTFDESLIELVQKNRLLYDLKSSGHNNAFARDSAWHKISTTLGRGVKDCKRRWITLRERYVKQKRLYERADTEGATPPAPWHLYHAMSFLAPFCKKRNRGPYSNSIDFEHLSELRLIDSAEASIFKEMAKSIANNGVVEVTMEDCNSQNATLERDFRLIELVKCHKVLYETTKAPIRAELRILAWRQIAKMMDMEWKKCRSRWITLRERFAKEYRREVLNKGSTVSHKPWYLYQAMSFLKAHVKLRSCPNNSQSQDDEEGDDILEDTLTKDNKSVDYDVSTNGDISASDDNNDVYLENSDMIEEIDDPLLEEQDEKFKADASLHVNSAKESLELYEIQTQNETDNEERAPIVAKSTAKSTSQRPVSKPNVEDVDDDEIAGFLVIIGRKLRSLELKYKNKAMEDVLQYCNAIQNFQMQYSNKFPAVVMSCTNCDMRHVPSSSCATNQTNEIKMVKSLKRKHTA